MDEKAAMLGTSSPEARRRRKSTKGAARREAILQAALHRFSHDGYQSASIAAIAADVGLSLPGLLHYFPTKVDLLLSILDRRDLEMADLVNDAGNHWRDFLLALRGVNRRNASLAGVVRAFSILNAESLIENHPAQAWFRRRALFLRERLAIHIAQGIEDREIREEIDPQGIAAELIGVMDGLQMLWLRLPESTDMVGIFDAYVQRLIAGIGSDTDQYP